jgi:hypothetical protein
MKFGINHFCNLLSCKFCVLLDISLFKALGAFRKIRANVCELM